MWQVFARILQSGLSGVAHRVCWTKASLTVNLSKEEVVKTSLELNMHMSVRFFQTLFVGVFAIPLQCFAAEYLSVYSNVDYGFVANLPLPMVLCTTPPPGSNHGFVALLDSESCEDNRVERQRRITVFAFYNVLDAKKAKDLSNDACGGALAARAAKETEIVSAGVHAYRCPPASEKKMIHWRYFFLGEIVFYVDLFTRAENSKKDMDVLKGLLLGIRWTGL